MKARYGSLPFEEAITFFKNKLNIPTERWADVWQQGHNSGFMVAGALKDDLLNDFRKAVNDAIAEGKSLTWFQKEFKSIVAKNGWDHNGKASWRAKVIYDTNMRQAYNAGRFEQLQHFDYWEYKHGDSKYPRELHLKWHGTLLKKEDKWWQTHMPQNGWGCKCKVFGRSKAQVERKGLTPGKAPDDGFNDWTDKVTGEVHKVPKGIDPGFDYAPQKSEVKKRQQKIATEKAKPFVAPKRVAPTAFSTVKGVNVHSLNEVLNQLKLTTAAPQIELLSQFINKYNTKTLFIKNNEMGRGKSAYAIKNDIASYLNMEPYRVLGHYTIGRKDKPEGFTSRSYEHVVVKVKSTHKLAKINVSNMISQLKEIITDGANKQGKHTFPDGDKRWFGFAEAGGGFESNESRLLTWLHEIGHQVHYKVGMPDRPTAEYLTKYSDMNEKEWFAEHFVAYILGREQLQQDWPEVTRWFDDILKKV